MRAINFIIPNSRGSIKSSLRRCAGSPERAVARGCGGGEPWKNVSFVQPDFDASSWRQLNLPHDWAVELPFDRHGDRDHGFKPIGINFPTNSIGWYRRTFELPDGDKGRALWIEFDGVYRNCLVWLNGVCLGRNVSGYGSFY